jgi:phosphatidate cytidylyltransferase
MAQPTERPPSDTLGGLTNLQKRTLSAAVLLPVVIAAVVLGHPYFTVLVAVFAGAMAWEFTTVAAHERVASQTSPIPMPSVRGWRLIAALGIVTALLAVIATGFGRLEVPVWAIIVLGVFATGVAVLVLSRRKALWFMLGVVYVATPAAALVAIRAEPIYGTASLVWIVALVAAADTGGYVAGRSIGGPKLAPRISPNKTWAGLIGGMAAAALVGVAASFLVDNVAAWIAVPASAALAVVEQAGDLFESAVKRRFGVKDSSRLIPGHGGVLDRVDGLLAVSLMIAALSGVVGHTILIWR